MKQTLIPGIKHEHSLVLTEQKMVPALYPESPEFQQMPAVFATGFMVGFLEWACLDAVIPHLCCLRMVPIFVDEFDLESG